jgi:hypothetical protein
VVFADCVSIYSVQRAVADKTTVWRSFDSGSSTLALHAAERPKLVTEFGKINESGD